VRPLGLGWPNVISIFRILLAPVLVVLVLSGSGLDYFWKAATRR
jgi:phosphatidylglycerophosphate synthase